MARKSPTKEKQRIGMAKSELTKLPLIWKNHHISKAKKKRIVATLVFKRHIETFEIFSYRRMTRITWVARITNQSILNKLEIIPNQRLLFQTPHQEKWDEESGYSIESRIKQKKGKIAQKIL